MKHESLPKVLARVDLFKELPPRVLEDLVQRGARLTTRPGHHVVDQGSVDAGLQVVLEGSAEVSVNGVPRGSLGPGDYFGEISLIDGQPRSATVITGSEGMTTFALSALAFAPVIAENPDVARALLRALCGRIRAIEATEGASP